MTARRQLALLAAESLDPGAHGPDVALQVEHNPHQIRELDVFALLGRCDADGDRAHAAASAASAASVIGVEHVTEVPEDLDDHHRRLIEIDRPAVPALDLVHDLA